MKLKSNLIDQEVFHNKQIRELEEALIMHKESLKKIKSRWADGWNIWILNSILRSGFLLISAYFYFFYVLCSFFFFL